MHTDQKASMNDQDQTLPSNCMRKEKQTKASDDHRIRFTKKWDTKNSDYKFEQTMSTQIRLLRICIV